MIKINFKIKKYIINKLQIKIKIRLVIFKFNLNNLNNKQKNFKI